MQSAQNVALAVPQNSLPPQLPVDVLSMILGRVRPTDLTTFCRVSKLVYGHAKDALYRDLILNGRNMFLACQKLTGSKDLARLVQSFFLVDHGAQVYLGALQDALLVLPNLRTLVLRIGHYGSWILPRGDNPPFQLQTFRCEFPYDSDLTAFLAGQLHLERLTVSYAYLGSPKPPRLSPSSCPALLSIQAPFFVIQDVLPGRPVRNVATLSFNDFDPGFLSSLSHSTAPSGLRRLMIDPQYLCAVGGFPLANAVPKLVHLIINADNLDIGNKRKYETLAKNIAEILPFLQPLKCVTFRFHPSSSSVPCKEIDFSSLVTRMFASSSNLHWVVITFYGLQAKYICKNIPGYDWVLCDN